MKHIAFCFIIHMMLTFHISGQPYTNKTFQVNDSIIVNPERGFYRHTEVHSENYQKLNEDILKSYKENQAITQILRVFYLEDFRNTPISKEYINDMHSDFNTLRRAGLKAIVRFAYTKKSSRPFGDASPAIVKAHIFQLKEIFTTHSDVIAVIQTGFVGAWGEWYYTDHFAGANPWIITEGNWADRRTLVNDLLKVLPKNRKIQLRTPGYKMKIFGSEEPISSVSVFTLENQGRVGHHNDCFVASSSDFGTYVNPELEKPYLEEETKHLPMGGETCALASPYSDCSNAYKELNRFHYSYLNIDYNTNVLDTWKDQGCYDPVTLQLGYRLALNEATITSALHPKNTFQLGLTLTNHGFANPYNERKLEVILKSQTKDQTYKLTTSEEIRLWPIQERFDVNLQAKFPEDMVEDTYDVYINLPDLSSSIAKNPDYSIQLANLKMWKAEEGYNDIGLTLTIDSSFPIDTSDQSLIFKDDTAIQHSVEGPKDIYAGAINNTAIVFFAKAYEFEFRRIEQSDDNINFNSIATIPGVNEYYKIIDFDDRTFYRYVLIDKEGGESVSNIIEQPFSMSNTNSTISTDGKDSDWQDILPTSSYLTEDQKSYIVRTHFSLEKAHFALYGLIDNYKIYLNTDQLKTTGFVSDDILEGMDYKIQNDSLFKFNMDKWIYMESSITWQKDKIHEIELPHEVFDNIQGNNIIPMVADINNDQVRLSESQSEPSVHIRSIPPDTPINFNVQNSEQYPSERLEVHWEECQYCEGYSLEKSDNGEDFSFLTEIDKDKIVYYHDFLEDGIHYYRIRSYNNLGESKYSEVKSGTIGTVSTHDPEQLMTLKVWPIPSSDVILTNIDYDHINIYNINGRLESTITRGHRHLSIGNLADGVYLLKFIKNGNTLVRKVIKGSL